MIEWRFLLFVCNVFDIWLKVIFCFLLKFDKCLENGNFCVMFILYNFGRNRKEWIFFVMNFLDNVVWLFIFLIEIMIMLILIVIVMIEKIKLYMSFLVF